MKLRKNRIETTRNLMFLAYLLSAGILFLFSITNVVYYIVLGFIFLFIFTKYKNWRVNRFLNSSLEVIDTMTGEEFEEYLQLILRKEGFKVYLTPKTADYGADLLLKRHGRKIVVQAKRWKRAVGVDAVQEVVASIKYYKAKEGWVITSSVFTENAKKLAEANNIYLFDRVELRKFINMSKEDNCPNCSSKLILKSGVYGEFFGCSRYPKCTYTKAVK